MISHSLPNDVAQHELTGLAAYLVRDGLLDTAQAQAAIQTASRQRTSLTHQLVKSAVLSSQMILDCCVKNFGLPTFDLTNYDAARLQDSPINLEFIYHYRVIPLERDEHFLHLGLTDPTDHAMMTALGFHTGLHIRPVLVAEAELDKIINTYCRANMLESRLEATLSKMTPLVEQTSVAENLEMDDEPVIQFVDRLIQDAIEKHISDIHIEPHAKHCRIRFRRDGMLYEAATVPAHLAIRIITRFKIMAALNIAERRLPQDGRIQLQPSATRAEKIDMRINTCPTLFGEKIVLRMVNTENMHLDMNVLGLTAAQKNIFLSALKQPQGMILVTGPTGSGKTATLYSALHYLNRVEKNISTVEDPVEIELPGINQVNINPRIGLDFITALRTFLRQDPDIIMIGEMRDAETANIALQAAQTGHLVLSTLHTNSAAETLMRLQSMGVIAHNLISSVSLIIAQRLARKLCLHCRDKRENSSYRLPGCPQCNQGFQGRIGIFELLTVTDSIAELIISGAKPAQIAAQMEKEGGMMLWDAGVEKVKEGTTNYAELMRVMGSHRSS